MVNDLEDEKEFETKTDLIEAERYLKTGCHIGTRFKSGEMRRYVYKVRKDGLKVLNIQTLDNRIKAAAKFLSNYEPKQIIAVARKLYGNTPVKEFVNAIGAKCYVGRFVPGTFTNPMGREFAEPGIIIVSEPEPDYQAVDEATRIKAPVIALCSTNNTTKNIDFVIPVNNKGRKSLALVFWLLAREYLKAKGIISKNSDFKKEPEEFEHKIKEGEEVQEDEYGRAEERNRRGKGKGKFVRRVGGRGRGDRPERRDGRGRGPGRRDSRR